MGLVGVKVHREKLVEVWDMLGISVPIDKFIEQVQRFTFKDNSVAQMLAASGSICSLFGVVLTSSAKELEKFVKDHEFREQIAKKFDEAIEFTKLAGKIVVERFDDDVILLGLDSLAMLLRSWSGINRPKSGAVNFIGPREA